MALRTTGHSHDADLIEKVLNAVCAAEPVRSALEWISEGDARLKSGRGVEYLRTRFSQWQSLGLAELRGKRRYYRGIIVPQRMHASSIRREVHREREEKEKD